MWTFSLHGPQAGASASENVSSPLPASTPEDPWKLDRLFAEVDKFCGHALVLTAAANHFELKQQLDFIAGSKQKLKLAQAEELARLKASHDKLDALEETAKRKEAARRQKIEERNQPLPPLDGIALARALLANLGLND